MISKITFDDVSHSFAENEIFDNLSLELVAGKVISIIGTNGSGKSTFLKLAGQFIQPNSGKITAFDGNEFIGTVAFRKKVSVIAPSITLYSELTGAENINFFVGLRDRQLTDNDIDIYFERVNLQIEDKYKIVGNFSTGMKQRLKFAIMLAVDTDVWLLDEPSSNLDEAGKSIILNEVEQAAQSGKLVLLATNDKDEAEASNEIISLPIR